MKVKCIANTGEKLSQRTLEAGHKKDFKLNVKVGAEYIVYSMVMWRGTLDYLILGYDSKCPSWYPAELFEVINPLLPFVWYCNFDRYTNYRGEYSQVVLWGYKEMIMDPGHNIALIEETTEALDIFFKRKCQMDEFEEKHYL